MKKLFELLERHKLLAPAADDTTDTGAAASPANEPDAQPSILDVDGTPAANEPPAGAPADNPSAAEPSAAANGKSILDPSDEGTDGADAGAKAKDVKKPEPDGLDEIKGVDGLEYAQGELEELKTLCKDHSLDPKAAQAILDWQAKFAKVADEKRTESLQSEMMEFVRKESEKNRNLVRKEWGEDPAVVAENEAAVARAMRKFSDDGFRKLMNESGLCNHPDVVRFVMKVGKAISDDRFISGRNGGGVKQDLAHRMFPESK